MVNRSQIHTSNSSLIALIADEVREFLDFLYWKKKKKLNICLGQILRGVWFPYNTLPGVWCYSIRFLALGFCLLSFSFDAGHIDGLLMYGVGNVDRLTVDSSMFLKSGCFFYFGIHHYFGRYPQQASSGNFLMIRHETWGNQICASTY